MKISDISTDIYSLFPDAYIGKYNDEVVIFTGMTEDSTGLLHPTKSD